jgi:hypothetical protein
LSAAPNEPGAAAGARSAAELPFQWRPDDGFQKINVKLFLDAPPDLDCDFLLAIFGRWRLEEGEGIVDLADYAHVEEGPGCILVSHRWHFGVDFSGGEPGLHYSTRKGLTGTAEQRIAEAVRGLLRKGIRLLGEKELPAGVRPRPGDLQVVLNDRLLAPNTDGAEAAWRPDLLRVVERLYGPGGAEVKRESDPARRLGWRIRATDPRASTLEELAGRLG